MQTTKRVSTFPVGVIATLLSAVEFYFATGLHPLWWLLWFAPVPVLLFVLRARGGTTFLVAGLA